MSEPSYGLMKLTAETFEKFRDPELSEDPSDPVANVVAATRYFQARYGDSTMNGNPLNYSNIENLKPVIRTVPMTKLEALKAAQEYVNGVVDRKNERGYPVSTLGTEARVALTLQVARFLYEEDHEEEA